MTRPPGVPRPRCPASIHDVYEELPLVAFFEVAIEVLSDGGAVTGLCPRCRRLLIHRDEDRASA